MKLLIITQKVDKNDPVLGFFHGWIECFALQANEVFVIANEVGEYNLQKNIKIYSLGKEKGVGKFKRYWKCARLISGLSKQVDGIFIHMCPEYAIFACFFSVNKKILMWYVHKSKNLKLWLAEKMVDKIFTVSENSCRIKSKKIEIVGHGIDVNKMQNTECRTQNDFFGILSVGRISPIKDYKTLIRAMCCLVNKRCVQDIMLTIVGDAYLKSDLEYKKEVEGLVKVKGLGDYIKITDSVSQNQLPEIYNSYDLFINLCPTGGMDKVVLEAAACELPALVANKSFEKMIGDYDLIFGYGKPEDLAKKILQLRNVGKVKRQEIGAHLREQVVKHHNLTNLVEKIIEFFTRQ